MSLKRHMRTAILFLLLQVGVLTGVTMRPEDIQKLLHRTRAANAEDTLRNEKNKRAKDLGKD